MGETFAGFRIVRLLGSGGMGEVYLAEHPRLPRHNALKVLPADVSADPDYRARFIREADLASKLYHPNIVGVHDRGEHEGQLWISMDYVDGVDAGRLLTERYRAGMPVGQVKRIVTALAGALDYAHKQGLLHRDVKPANIMVTHVDEDDDQQRILLADFGIARNVGDISGLTATNFTVGTLAYSAPEQLMGKDLDGRADQYALAATAYQLLTGSQLFPHSNQAVVISHHLTQPAPAPSTIRPELAPLDVAFARALAKSPDDRFDHCQDFACAITAGAVQTGVRFSPGAPTEKAPVPAVDPAGTAAGRRSRAWPVLAAVAVIVFLAAASVLIWRPWSYRGQPPISTSKTPAPSATPASPTPLTTTTAIPSGAPSLPPVTSSPPPPSQTVATPPRPTYPPAGQIGSACPPPGGAIGTGPDGAIYYCDRIEGTDGYEWALTPGLIPNPALHQPLNILTGPRELVQEI